MKLFLSEGQWLICLNGHKAWRVVRDVPLWQPIMAKDLVDEDGNEAEAGKTIRCPKCGAKVRPPWHLKQGETRILPIDNSERD